MQKTVLITGANSGIGFETARQLASRGDSIVMVCRDSARGQKARSEIAKATGRAPALFLADLSSQDSIRSLAAESELQELSDPESFARYLAPLHDNAWVVYAKAPFGGPDRILDYLGRYTHPSRSKKPSPSHARLPRVWKRRMRRASSIATSSWRTSSSRPPAWSRFSTSAWPNRRANPARWRDRARPCRRRCHWR